jgi:hypothetical protein
LPERRGHLSKSFWRPAFGGPASAWVDEDWSATKPEWLKPAANPLATDRPVGHGKVGPIPSKAQWCKQVEVAVNNMGRGCFDPVIREEPRGLTGFGSIMTNSHPAAAECRRDTAFKQPLEVEGEIGTEATEFTPEAADLPR